MDDSSAGASGSAHDASVRIGPPSTPEQDQAMREREAAEAEAAVARLEAKAEHMQGAKAADLQGALDRARAEAQRLRQRAQKGDNG